MLKQSDHPAHADHRQHGSDAHADQTACKQQAQGDRDGDVQKIKAVFGKADIFVDAVRDGLHNSIPRVGDNSHGKRHRSAHAGADDRQNQNQQTKRKVLVPAVRAGGKIRQESTEQIEKPGKNQAERDLQNIHQQNQFLILLRACSSPHEMQNQFDCNENTVENHRHVSEVASENLRCAVRDRNNRRNTQTRFGVQRQTHRQDEKPHNIE